MKIRLVEEKDLKSIRSFVKNNPPLEIHTLYTYWMLYSQFKQLWYVCELDGEIVGFISGIKNLAEVPTALIWQICVEQSMRGKGLSKLLINQFMSACKQLNIKQGLVTIDPKNKVSLALFKSYFDVYSSFERCGNLELSDEFSLKDEFENIYSFEI